MALTHRGPFILIFALDQQLSDLLGAAMAQSPLSPADFAVTSVLRLTGPIRPTDLATAVGMRPTSLSNYLRRLTEARLVRRRPDPDDGRAALVSLTARGIRLTEACFPAFSVAIETFREQLTAEGIDEVTLLDSLEGMSRALSGAKKAMSFARDGMAAS